MGDRWLLDNPAGPREDRPDISASEIGDFTYCARSWWLKRVAGYEVQGPPVSDGAEAHQKVGSLVASVVAIERLVKVLVVGVAVTALVLVGHLSFR